MTGVQTCALPISSAQLAEATSSLAGTAGLLVASASWALGSVLSRRWPVKVDAFAAAGWQMTFAGTLNVLIAFALGEFPRAHWSAKSLGAIAYLVVFGSWAGFSAYIWLLNHVPTSKVSTYAYVNPVVAVLLGWLVLKERLDGYVLAGAAVIVAAVALVTSAKVHRRVEPAPAPTPEPELPACEQGAD